MLICTDDGVIETERVFVWETGLVLRPSSAAFLRWCVLGGVL